MAEQNFANHTKLVPAFHFFGMPVLLVNMGWSLLAWKRHGFSMGGLMGVLVAIALVVLFTAARLSTLAVQDRVIRLEERLRCERLLPAGLQARIGEFTLGQLVALRFASDGELPGLAQKVLDEKLTDRKAIKRLIKNWKPDHLRA